MANVQVNIEHQKTRIEPGEELIYFRFIPDRAYKRGYHFEKRKVTAQQYEYKMTVREIA